jgi:NAD(P)H-dependent FMN reductase
MQVLILVGSVRPGSNSRATAAAIENALVERGADVVTWDPRNWHLPLADPLYHRNPRSHPDQSVQALVEAAQRADGFALVSPVYHNSYSALLKNCLDHLTNAQFRYKPVALASHGARLSAVQACDHLRIVVRALHGLALPRQLVTVPEEFLIGEDEEPVLLDPLALERIEEIATDLLFYARVGQARLAGGGQR